MISKGVLTNMASSPDSKYKSRKRIVADEHSRYVDYCIGFAHELAELPRKKAMKIRLQMETLMYEAVAGEGHSSEKTEDSTPSESEDVRFRNNS